MQTDSYFITLHKTQDLNRELNTLNLIKQKVGNNFEFIRVKDNIFNLIPVAQALRSTVDKWNLIKLQSFCNKKDTVNKTKMASYRMRKYL